MASDRGTYRSISTVLLDGKDFHRLSERERFVFLTLKLNLGPSGIEVHYPQALAATVAAQTGIPFEAVMDALAALQAAGWVEIEGNVIWICRQLEFEPSMKPNDDKHRKSIQRHALGLPRLSIVGRFMAAYPEWFPSDEFDAPEGLVTPSEGPNKALPRPSLLPNTEDRRPKTDTEDRDRSADAPPPKAEERKPSGKPTRGRTTWRTVPEDWQPKTRHHDYAAQHGLDFDRQIERFRSHEYQRPKKDADLAFDNWLSKAVEFGESKRTGNGGNGHRQREEVTGAVNGADRRLRREDEGPPTPISEETKRLIAETKRQVGRG